jgi:hypothetical protein
MLPHGELNFVGSFLVAVISSVPSSSQSFRRFLPRRSHQQFIGLVAYAAAWRDAPVKELRACEAAADHCLSAVLERRLDEARCLRMTKGAKTHRKARSHRAWRRNAERMPRNRQRNRCRSTTQS